MVKSGDCPRRTEPEQRGEIRPAAAASIQNPGVRPQAYVGEPPPRHSCMAAVHHGHHQLPAKALGLTGVPKEFTQHDILLESNPTATQRTNRYSGLA